MLCAALLALSTNRVEISTGNLRSDNKFDNVKGMWEHDVKVGDLKTTVRANYDYNENSKFIKEISLSGNLIEADQQEEDSVTVGYSSWLKVAPLHSVPAAPRGPAARSCVEA
jgi:hypothetical protein